MLTYFREKINTVRQDISSYQRKIRINRRMDKSKVVHLEKSIDCNYCWYGTSYGGFYIIPGLLSKYSVIYSFGIGKDISFDLCCIKKHACQIHAFDPTPKSIDWIRKRKLPDSFHFHEYGISVSVSGMADFYLPANPKAVSGSMLLQNETAENKLIQVPMKSFDAIIAELGHKHIDVLKMDIEGAEYEVLKSILEAPVTITQILVEFHDRLFDQDEFKSKEIVSHMADKGYAIFACSGSYEEISFVHRDTVLTQAGLDV